MNPPPPPPRQPLFLGRQGYKRRRLMDAGRLLPVLGALLLGLPMLWEPGGASDATGGARTASVAVYLFAVWFGLIATAFVLSRRLLPPRGPADGLPEPRHPPAQDDGGAGR